MDALVQYTGCWTAPYPSRLVGLEDRLTLHTAAVP
jgi:hypothetical protein